MITYAPFWKTMKKKGMTTYKLIYKLGVSSSTVNRLRHNQGITTQVLNDLCNILHCRVEDVLEFIPDENPQYK